MGATKKYILNYWWGTSWKVTTLEREERADRIIYFSLCLRTRIGVTGWCLVQWWDLVLAVWIFSLYYEWGYVIQSFTASGGRCLRTHLSPVTSASMHSYQLSALFGLSPWQHKMFLKLSSHFQCTSLHKQITYHSIVLCLQMQLTICWTIQLLKKVKARLSLCFNWAPRHEGVLGE